MDKHLAIQFFNFQYISPRRLINGLNKILMFPWRARIDAAKHCTTEKGFLYEQEAAETYLLNKSWIELDECGRYFNEHDSCFLGRIDAKRSYRPVSSETKETITLTLKDRLELRNGSKIPICRIQYTVHLGRYRESFELTREEQLGHNIPLLGAVYLLHFFSSNSEIEGLGKNKRLEDFLPAQFFLLDKAIRKTKNPVCEAVKPK